MRLTGIVQFLHRFPKASLVTNVVKTLVANLDSRGTTRRMLGALLAYYGLSGVTSGHSVYWMCFIKTHPIPRNAQPAGTNSQPKTVVTADILLIDYC